MGQYYKIVNLDKKEFLNTYTFNDGAKLLELGCSSEGTLTALAILLADGNGRGGGDLHSENPIIGSWAGDRIVVAGDYADEHKFLSIEQIAKHKMLKDGEEPNLYNHTVEHFKDISEAALIAMLDDQFIYDVYEKADLYGKAKEIFAAVKKKRDRDQEKPVLAKAG
ncbi:MAG: hypothetical protein PF570_04700 [Candidatus Cloacimonetes bacterium]|jgi:hypothetical protein|nr:hypothetical protein [Candidatus Cloacimonadota bacterium]